MTNLLRVRVALDGWPGAPGVNTLMFSQGTYTNWTQAVVDEVQTNVNQVFLDWEGLYPSGVTLQVEQASGVIDADTGNLVDVITASTAQGELTGSASGTLLSRATQLGVRLVTSDFRAGRRVQGRCFMGPLSAGAFDPDGSIDPGIRTDVAASWQDLIDAEGANLCIYTRPKSSPATPGQWADVTSASVSSKPFVLRSRRD